MKTCNVKECHPCALHASEQELFTILALVMTTNKDHIIANDLTTCTDGGTETTRAIHTGQAPSQKLLKILQVRMIYGHMNAKTDSVSRTRSPWLK